MSTLAESLKTYLISQMKSAVGGVSMSARGAGDALRLSFSGPPKRVLEELFDLISDDDAGLQVDIGGHQQPVPVFLVDRNAVDPTSQASTARCTPNYLVTIRNHGYKCLLVLHEVGEAINQSVSTTIKPLGVSPIASDLEEWMQEPLIAWLLDKGISACLGTSPTEQAWACVKATLRETWEIDQRNRDKRSSWDAIERLLAFGIGGPTGVECLSAALGLPRCAASEIGTDSHISTLDALGKMLENEGLSSGFEELKAAAAQEQDVIEALKAVRLHLSDNGVIEASEFSRTPIRLYAPVCKEMTSVPLWWKNLPLDVWARLLSADSTPAGKLEVRVEDCIIHSPKGLPPLVLHSVRLSISIKDAPATQRVAISRAVDKARFATLAEVDVGSGEAVCWEDASPPDHSNHVRYKVECDGYSPVTLKAIALDKYQPGVVAVVRNAVSAKPFALNRRARDEKNAHVARWEGSVDVGGMGFHHLDLLVRPTVTLGDTLVSFDTTADNPEPISRVINHSDGVRWSCLIETDEESYFDFQTVDIVTGAVTSFRVNVAAQEVDPTEVISQFQRLLLENHGSATGNFPRTRVEARNCRSTDIEELALESSDSFRPLIFGPDYLNAWRQPNWLDAAPISHYALPVDPRPTGADFTPPQSFIDARDRVREALRATSEDQAPLSAGLLRLYELMRQESFVLAVRVFIDEYINWLALDSDSALWSDVIALHAAQEGVRALEATPYAILLTPLHPIRLGWQCQAQAILQEAIDTNSRCPAASTLLPAMFPDCLSLACRGGAGAIIRKPFAAMPCSSDYWSVLWSVDALGRFGRGGRGPILTPDFGVTADGLTSSFSSAQVVRSLDEVRRLLSGRSTLRVRITADTTGPGSLNDGIESWCAASIGPDADCWASSGGNGLCVIDKRPIELQPEQAALASLTAKADSSVQWFDSARVQRATPTDLSIIAHLGAINHEFGVHGLRSAIDRTALTRWRVRRQLATGDSTFIGESRVAEKPVVDDRESLTGSLLTSVDHVESLCRQWFDSYVFAPHMALLTEGVASSSYCAVSSTSIDAACFFGRTGDAYLWDYELPSYAQRAGENSGYFLLAKHSPAMATAVRSALESLGPAGTLTDAGIHDLLDEISRRGMPTLKRLTVGGSTSLGEIGTLVSLRILQSEFRGDGTSNGIVPVVHAGETLTLIVPADPFAYQFDDLRSALGIRAAERPDLIVISLRYESDRAATMRVTPIEIKARSGAMAPADRSAALSQASSFGHFLRTLQDVSTSSALWGIAYRSLFATLIEYGFRVYGQLPQFRQQDDWARRHSLALQGLGSGELSIDIDARGRLIVIDSTNTSTHIDLDDDKFKETLTLSHRDSVSLLLSAENDFLSGIRNAIGSWELLPSAGERPGIETPAKDTPAVREVIVDHGDSGCDDDISSIQRHPDPVDDQTGSVIEVRTSVSATAPEPSSVRESTSMAIESDTRLAEGDANARGIQFDVGRTINCFTEETMAFCPGSTALNHLNIGVVGDLGTGKTQLVQSLLYQLRRDPGANRGQSPNVLIFDYKKDYSKPAFIEATGATVVRPHQLPLNMFGVPAAGSLSGNLWLERSKFFCDVLDKIYSNIGPKQRQKIKQAVRQAYDNTRAGGQGSPTLHDVFDAYSQASGGDVDSPFSIMSDLVDGEYFVSSSDATIPFGDFLRGVVVVDLASVGQDDRTKNMLVVVFLNLFYEHMLQIEKKPFLGESPQTRYVDTMLLVDEADNIMKYEFEVLNKILLQGREFGVGVLLASQYLSHFRTAHENYAEPLLTWFVHKVPRLTVKDLEGIGIAGANLEMVNAVKTLQCHECLYKTVGVDGRFIRGIPFYKLARNESG
jgi:hypothetical protein